MNLNLTQRKFAGPAIAGAAALLAAAFSVAAQPTNGTDFASFQVISQRNIFDPNRVPHTHYNATHTARVADSFSFLGTMSYEKGNFAFFDGTSPDFRKVLELNGDIAGFKVTALASKSVTLVSGTNEMILPVGTQVRRDDDGHWAVSTEPASFSGAGNSHAAGSGRHRRGQDGSARNNLSTISTTTADNSQPDDSTTTDSGTDTNAPDASTLSSGGANDALTRLMQQRAQEEQQLGQGQ
jgi:hypothetical protein